MTQEIGSAVPYVGHVGSHALDQDHRHRRSCAHRFMGAVQGILVYGEVGLVDGLVQPAHQYPVGWVFCVFQLPDQFVGVYFSQVNGIPRVYWDEQIGQIVLERLYCPMTGDSSTQVTAYAIGQNAHGDRVGI